jgi:hypothetical protein
VTSVYAPSREHYAHLTYDTKKRWSSYWHQIDEALAVSPATVLVVGVGSGVVPACLRAGGLEVTTLDVVPELAPDVVADVRAIPAERGAFDVVLCCQVLEHLQFTAVPAAVAELARVARTRVVISLPRRGRYWQIAVRVPPLPLLTCGGVFPNRRRYRGDLEHCWELGPRAVRPRDFRLLLAKHLELERSYHVPDHPYHQFFVGRPSSTGTHA